MSRILIRPEGLSNTLTLEVQAEFAPKAAGARAKDFVELRFVEEMKKSGFIDKLYGRGQVSKH